MQKFILRGFNVMVQQMVVLTSDTFNKQATLMIDDNNIDIHVLDEEGFNNIYYSDACYKLIVQYKNDNLVLRWNIDLEDNDIECNDFIIKKNNDYADLENFMRKVLLHNKLESKLAEKPVFEQKKI